MKLYNEDNIKKLFGEGKDDDDRIEVSKELLLWAYDTIMGAISHKSQAPDDYDEKMSELAEKLGEDTSQFEPDEYDKDEDDDSDDEDWEEEDEPGDYMDDDEDDE